MPPNDSEATQRICIIGGGAAGVALAWSLGRATELGLAKADYDITLIHDQADIGGHSVTKQVTLNGKPVNVDCGVQAIAPTWYPMTMSMLALPAFEDVGVEPLDMKIACAFPGDAPGSMQYWGNFGDYFDTPLAESGKHDCEVFEELLRAKFSISWGLSLAETVDELLEKNAHKFTNGDTTHFKTYFLDGYMSILNGYGDALLDELLVGDLAALWDIGYASFTKPITNYGRFKQGAMEWVDRMWSLAKQQMPAVKLLTSTRVTHLYPSDAGPTVVYEDLTTKKSAPPVTFDVVVSTIDMRGSSNILNHADNPLWSSVYEPRIGTACTDNRYATSVWPLKPGLCALHQDPDMLAKTPGEEVLQFNALPGRKGDGPGFTLPDSWSTYLVSNLNGIPGVKPEDDWYVTMYGFYPEPDQMPKRNLIWHEPWTHGMFLPTFMVKQKLLFQSAQGTSPYRKKPFPGQHDTGIYFAGNNLTMDAEEGALISGLAITKYAFGLDPITLLTPSGGAKSKEGQQTLEKAQLIFDAFYDGLMFPSLGEDIAVDVAEAIAWFLKHWLPVIGPANKA